MSGPTQTTPSISLSIFQREIDLSTKDGARLYEVGSESLPEPFSGQGKDLRVFINGLQNRAKKCMWSDTVLIYNVGGTDLNLLKDYGRIPMQVLKDARDLRNGSTPTTHAQARASIDSMMMFECIEKSVDSRVATKLLKQATSIDRDGPVMFKQIIENTFVTTTPTTFATKTELFSLDLKDFKHNIVVFHEEVREKIISLEAVGHTTSDLDLVVSLFKAYETSENDLFLLEVRMLQSAYNRGDLKTSDELMSGIEAKYDELIKTHKWKVTKAKEDPNLVALTAKVNDLTALLASNKTFDKGGKHTPREGQGKGPWKYDKSLGTNGSYVRKTEGRDPKTYDRCEGPGHGGRPMWVCGHKPGACTDDPNHPRNSGRTGSDSAKPATGGSGASAGASDATIQALGAVLEDNNFSDDSSAQFQACLALIGK